jgi:hypothetical protein
VVALRETMNLAAERAVTEAKSPAMVWPELLMGPGAAKSSDAKEMSSLARDRWPELAMAHSDCYACHHDLKYPGFRQQRGYGYHLPGGPLISTAPGRPTIRGWPLALLKAGVVQAGKPAQLGVLEEDLKALARTCNARPFGDPAGVANDARTLIKWCDAMIADLRSPALYSKETLQKLLVDQCSLYDTPTKASSTKESIVFIPDYETARQLASLIQVVYQDWRQGGPGSSEMDAALKRLDTQLDVYPYVKRSDRLEVILQAVKQIANRPDLTGLKEFNAYLNDIGNKALLEKMIDNNFLDTMQRRVSNESFTKEVLKDAVIKKLQQLSDDELNVELKSIADYDPKEFLETVRSLAKLAVAKK